MIPSSEDSAKRRLVEAEEIAAAVVLLLEHGYAVEDIGPQLSRFYYVDVDTLNAVLEALPAAGTASSGGASGRIAA
jgi:hypothetical protein